MKCVICWKQYIIIAMVDDRVKCTMKNESKNKNQTTLERKLWHWITTFKEELSLADNVYFVGYSDNRYDKANNWPLYYG